MWYFFFPGYNLILFAVGSLLPDSDTRKSFMGKVVPLWIIAKHRGWTHSIWGLILFTFLLGHFTNVRYGFSLGLGYLLHLTMDWLTPRRVNWLYNKRKKKR